MTTSMTKYAPPGSMADRINKMSNANVNSTSKGVMKGAGGAVKSTHGGKDLGMNATNVIEKIGHNPKEYGPSATCVGVGAKGKKKY
jgi:hypothetical protein